MVLRKEKGIYTTFVCSKKVWDMPLLADSGYQGIQKIHAKSRIPKKSSKKHPLTRVEKRQNRELSIERILIENINAKIKVFKIFSQKYRNRRKRHQLQMSLVCGIYNFEL